MYCRILAATALLAGSTLMAVAQENAAPPPPDGGPQAQEGTQVAPPPPAPKQERHRDWHHGKRHGHSGMRHQRHHRADRGPGMHGKGFALSLGFGRDLRVNCGEEPIKACVDATAPLIDSLSRASMHRRGPGMRHGRGVDMGPGGKPGTPPEPPMPDAPEQE